MNESKSSIQIGKKTFISSALILFALMIVSGILTKIIPSGTFDRIIVDGRTVINPSSFKFTEISGIPFLRWFTAPI